LRHRSADFVILGDRARDARQWELAARLYRQALDRNPGTPDIWVQYGHALKESGELREPDKLAQAEVAYRKALWLDPSAADSYLQLGHVLKLEGKTEEARAAYLRAFALDPSMPYPLDELGGLGWSELDLAELKKLVEPIPANGHDVAAPMLSTLAPASQPVDPVADSDLDPKLWFFVGDTLDWLRTHDQLTGVGRVTVELLLAALDPQSERQALPCVFDSSGRGLVPVSRLETASYLDSRLGTHVVLDLLNAADERAPQPEPTRSPRFGDHVVFTGVVWTPTYRDLFRRLSGNGITFSVLVHDIIPLERPDLVTEQYHEMFRDWLETTITLANVIFVSSSIIGDQILRWAIVSGIYVRCEIIPITFGSRNIEKVRSDLKSNAAMARIDLGSFVLSVGTIDKRKNQEFLCRLWKRLVSECGASRVPQLALVGREDLKIGDIDEGVASLLKASKIAVLEGLSDAELESLYDACLFTVFPSLSEGYGIPVAESFQHGKLCLSSDLAVIREQAGNLPWYFDPSDEGAAYDLLRRAIEDPAGRADAERRIIQLYRPCSWALSYRTMSKAAYERSQPRAIPDATRGTTYRPVIPGISVAPLLPTLATSQKWCTDVDPEVSILIINWNAGQLTCECLTQIWANTEDVRYEIIIADNGSDPAEIAPLRLLGRGVRLIELGTNRFFGEANNIAAEMSRGRYICLLNNDAFAQPGWLRSLVDDLERTPAAGAVGPLFLFPDNTIQEAGAIVDEAGYPVRFGRGRSAEDPEFLVPKYVDYISAATLLMTRELFMRVGGFDLAYEPAYYEDTDLCFKLRALGQKVHYCPDAQVIHIEGSAANNDPAAEARRKALGDLNRDKFTARWGTYLKSRSDADLERLSRGFQCNKTGRAEGFAGAEEGRRVAAVFTPYPLTPGGGERYLLTLAAALTADYAVTIVTPHPYSYLRLLSLAREFSIDLSACRLMAETEFLSAPRPDLMVAMGNQVIPPIAARAPNSLYMCQFPFPMSKEEVQDTKGLVEGYRCIIANSEYAKAHIVAKLSAFQLPALPVEVIHPPVPSVGGDASRKKPIILSVGRFFRDKRHDVMISAFRSLTEQSDQELELHLAGSSIPHHMDYLGHLREMAGGIPVIFHVNAPPKELVGLYRDAAVYWHGTGLDADLDRQPEEAEHFGITIVEAMSAQCVPLAFNAGGPRELITHGIDGFLYGSREELTEMTRQLFAEEFAIRRQAIGRAAGQRAASFSLSNFNHKMNKVIAQA
jgi:GT2 family glycosyltransferase/glycosyltransferase involved in cell wall biosynthesis